MASPDAQAELPPPGDADALYVVDISGYVFRAYHALPELSSPAGEPTHAVLGVTSMLLKLVADHRPAMLAVAMDSRTRSFRHELYDAYKANRPPAPPDLKQQMARVAEVVDAYAIPVLQQDGVEADDVIASTVRKAREQGMSVVIVSSDKDLLQLVGDGVWMLDTARNAVFGPTETRAKLGVPPSQVRDYLALVGDSSDNVPGVPSVGPKTAVQLLEEHGDLDTIYAHLDQVTRKALKAKLEGNRDQAYLSRELVTLKEDVPVEVDREALRFAGADVPRLRALFQELGFTRLLDQLPDADAPAAAPVAPAPEPLTVEAVLDDAALTALAERLGGLDRCTLCCVYEGRHHVRGALAGIAVGWSDGAAYVPVGHSYLGAPAQLEEAAVWRALSPALEAESPAKLCADAKRETAVLARQGVTLAGVSFDVMLASYLIDPEGHGHRLGEVSRFELGHTLAPETVELAEGGGKGGRLCELDVETAAERAGQVLGTVWQAVETLGPRLEDVGCAALLRDVELPLAAVLAEMELTGIRVDASHLKRLSGEVGTRLIELEAECKRLAGHDFNVGSPRQLESILFDELELPVIKRTKTARSTDQSVLEELALHHELPATILEHRMLAKLQNTYLEALPKQIDPVTGRIHTDFRQAVAATGRLSSSDPNLQNIPVRTEVGRSIREAFVPREGWELLSADYSQIELRVLAHLSADPELVAAYRESTDVHVRTARAIFGVDEEDVTREMRGQAKTVNFAVIYGQTQFALARNLRIERSEAARYIKAFFEQYAGVKAYMERIVEEGRERGEVRTLCDRVRRLPDLRSPNRVKRQAAERVARNTPIQGSAADIIKLAMVAVARELHARKLESRMLLTVHDELVFEAPPEEHAALEKLVVEQMEGVMKLDVPLVVDRGWGPNWEQAH